MECEICGRGPFDDVPIYRNGVFGLAVPWRCIDHLDEEYKPKQETNKDCCEITIQAQ